MFKFFKRQPAEPTIVFRANFYVDHTWTPKRCACGLKVWSAIAINGTCAPSCGHVDCNKKVIQQWKVSK